MQTTNRYSIVEDWITPSGYRAVTILVRESHHCGYVAVPKGHPYYGLDFDQPIMAWGRILVHGGVTYTGSNDGYPAASDEDVWWIGFDCCHSGDATLRDDPDFDLMAVFRDADYVHGECDDMAQQLKAEVGECL